MNEFSIVTTIESGQSHWLVVSRTCVSDQNAATRAMKNKRETWTLLYSKVVEQGRRLRRHRKHFTAHYPKTRPTH